MRSFQTHCRMQRLIEERRTWVTRLVEIELGSVPRLTPTGHKRCDKGSHWDPSDKKCQPIRFHDDDTHLHTALATSDMANATSRQAREIGTSDAHHKAAQHHFKAASAHRSAVQALSGDSSSYKGGKYVGARAGLLNKHDRLATYHTARSGKHAKKSQDLATQT